MQSVKIVLENGKFGERAAERHPQGIQGKRLSGDGAECVAKLASCQKRRVQVVSS